MDNPVNTFAHTVPSSLPSVHRVRRGCLTRLPHTRLGRLARQATQKAFLSTSLNYLGLRLYGPLGNCKTPSGRIKPMIPRAWGVIISQFSEPQSALVSRRILTPHCIVTGSFGARHPPDLLEEKRGVKLALGVIFLEHLASRSRHPFSKALQ